MANLNELTMKELSKIAKDEYNLALSVTIEGKRKRYTKKELIDMIELKLSQDYSSLYPSILDIGTIKGSKLTCNNVTIGKGKSKMYGSLFSSNTIKNEIPPLETMVKESKELIAKGEYEKVKGFISHLQNEIKESNNSLLMNKLSKTLLLVKSLLIMNKKEVF